MHHCFDFVNRCSVCTWGIENGIMGVRNFLFENMSKKFDKLMMGLTVLHRPGDASMRQALEAVIIRKEDPPLNRKQEWTNEPRKRKIIREPITPPLKIYLTSNGYHHTDVLVNHNFVKTFR